MGFMMEKVFVCIFAVCLGSGGLLAASEEPTSNLSSGESINSTVDQIKAQINEISDGWKADQSKLDAKELYESKRIKVERSKIERLYKQNVYSIKSSYEWTRSSLEKAYQALPSEKRKASADTHNESMAKLKLHYQNELAKMQTDLDVLLQASENKDKRQKDSIVSAKKQLDANCSASLKNLQDKVKEIEKDKRKQRFAEFNVRQRSVVGKLKKDTSDKKSKYLSDRKVHEDKYAENRKNTQKQDLAEFDASHKVATKKLYAVLQFDLMKLEKAANAEIAAIIAEKDQAKADYEQGLVMIDLAHKFAAESQLVENLKLDDSSAKLVVNKLKFAGNNLVSSADIINGIPAVFFDRAGLKGQLERELAGLQKQLGNIEDGQGANSANLSSDSKASLVQVIDELTNDIGELNLRLAELDREIKAGHKGVKEGIVEDEKVAKFLYDFRPIYEVILSPESDSEVSVHSIKGFTQYVLSLYQDTGYRGIYVYIPKEVTVASDTDKNGIALKDKILPVTVLESEVSEVGVRYYEIIKDPNSEGNKLYPELGKGEKGWLSDEIIKEWSPVKDGKVVNSRKLDRFVNLLNLNSDRYVSPVISKGSESDNLAVTYDVYEADPWHLFVQVDDSGSEERQWQPRVGISNTNLTGRDDRLTGLYQGSIDHAFDDNYSIFGSYDVPILGPGLRMNFFGGHSRFDRTTDGPGGFNFRGDGDFAGGVARLNIYQRDEWFIDFTTSLSRELSKTNVLDMKTNIEMNLWGLGFEAYMISNDSSTFLSLNRSTNICGSGTDRFEASRTDANPEFSIYTASAKHWQYLDIDKVQRFSGSFLYRVSDERLTPAKMTTFGGFYSVRGYNEEGIAADGGYLASLQYEFDLVGYDRRAMSDEEKKTNKPWIRKLAPLVFTDYGRAVNRNHVAGEERVEELSSVGAGIVATFGDNIDMGVYYGYPLRSAGETKRGDAQWNAVITVRW